MNHQKYTIIDSSEIGSIDFSQILNVSSDRLPFNVAGDQAIVKFEGETPSFLLGKSVMDHAEALELVSNPEWKHLVEEE